MLDPSTFEQLPESWLRQAAKDGVSRGRVSRAKWFRIQGCDGFCAYLPINSAGTKVRIKGFWIAPEWRGRGLGEQAFDALLERIKTDFPQCSTVESISRKIDFYKRKGFTPTAEMPSATTAKYKWVREL